MVSKCLSKDQYQSKLQPIRIAANNEIQLMNQSEFLAININLLEARKNSRLQGAIGFGFASHWLKTWQGIFKAITKRKNRNRVINFDSHFDCRSIANEKDDNLSSR